MQRCSGGAGKVAGVGGAGGGGVATLAPHLHHAHTGAAAAAARRHHGYDGGKIAGLYDLEETLGRGHFAVVKLARHVFTGEKVAVKVIDKSKLDEVSRAHLFQEVRCMKLVQHPNVVRLYEVIDTQTKLYLILELADGGDLYDYIMRHETGLSEELAREYFRQIVRAISYCHRLHVVHRDLKPENVVFFERLGMVKLTDFGFSNRFNPGQKLETSCGSLAYSAPEILLGDSYDAPAVDIWSLGVILYMLVCGQAPFQEANDSETLTMIMDCKYTVPAHVSDACKRLISKMLLREPERRATLEEIASDPWLAETTTHSHQQPADFLPLVSREHLSDEDHALIIQKMVNGNIASKEEILEALDKNEYNHITATYFLLAERKLRAHRQEQAQMRLRQCGATDSSAQYTGNKPALKVVAPSQSGEAGDVVAPTLHTVTRPGEPQQNYRTRKCSIVQEEEDEDDMSSCSGREELTPPHNSLNRRGSRSEGKINIAVQERIKEAELRKEKEKSSASPTPTLIKPGELRPRSAVETGDPKAPAYIPGSTKWRVSSKTVKVTRIQTSVITESSTVSIPITTQCDQTSLQQPRFRTLPNPLSTRTTDTQTLNEIFEETETLSSPSSRPIRTGYHQSHQQRRTKFHKARTASCSSSDASDDDSESRKKRAHKLATPNVTKPLTQRRDSHDDSSDSQDPSCSGGGGGSSGGGNIAAPTTAPPATHNGGSGGGESRDISDSKQAGRRHRAGRRRAGETRLRESQSLNRITEVQEAEAPTTNKPWRPLIEEDKPKETRLDERVEFEKENQVVCPKPLVSNDIKPPAASAIPPSTEKHSKSGKKMRLLGRYFQVHKKLCIPLPLFGRGRLYKAQSCGSIVRERVAPVGGGATSGDRWCKPADTRETALEAVLPLAACPAITICRIHLGDASKCCNLC